MIRTARRTAFAAAAFAAFAVGSTAPAQAQTYVVTRVYRPAPVVVFRPYAPPVVIHRRPVVVQRWYRVHH